MNSAASSGSGSSRSGSSGSGASRSGSSGSESSGSGSSSSTSSSSESSHSGSSHSGSPSSQSTSDSSQSKSSQSKSSRSQSSSSSSSSGCKESEKKNFYAGGQRNVATLQGAYAKISTNETVLNCEPNGTFADDSFAWVGVTKTSGSSVPKWAQTGYVRFRTEGSKTIHKNKYWEVKAGPNAADYKITVDGFPGIGLHDYECDLNDSTGNWTFFYDGTPWGNWTHNGWKNESGNRADYTGEIHHKLTQMPGKPSDKCNYRSCKFHKKGLAYEAANFAASDISSSDNSEWGVELVGAAPTDAINIWDKKPPFAP